MRHTSRNRSCHAIGRPIRELGILALSLLLVGPLFADEPALKPRSEVGDGYDTLFGPNTTHAYLEHASQFPFRHEARDYDLINAWWLSEASMLAYTPPDFAEPILESAGLDQFRFFDNPDGTQCFVAHNERFAIVAFRGTEPDEAKDLRADAKFSLVKSDQGGKVHRGFKKSIDSIWPDLYAYLNQNLNRDHSVWLTGHSLGGALATLAARRYPRTRAVYTFGSPRVGNDKFADEYRPTQFRFRNQNDLIAQIPMKIAGFSHVGSLHYIDGHGKIHVDPPASEINRDERKGGEDNRERLKEDGLKKWFRGAKTDGVYDHAPIFYVLAIWNAVVGEERILDLPVVRFSEIESLKGRILQETEHYAIDDTVRIDGPYYLFDVKADHGEYKVKSAASLDRTCHEIKAIEEFRKLPAGEQAWEGAKEAMLQLGHGAVAIITSPVASTKAVARTIGRSVRAVTDLAKGKKEKSSTGDRTDSAAGGLLSASQARNLAYDLQVDVYTSNPFLRALLTSVADSEALGSIGVSLATSMLSLPPGLKFATLGALTPGAHERQVELLIRDNGPRELAHQLNENYTTEFGLKKKKANKAQLKEFESFLKNPNYTPRELAYLSHYLTNLAEVEGHRETVRNLGAVETVAQASFIGLQLELYNAAHQGDMKLSRLIPLGNRMAAQTQDGSVLVLAPYDVGEENDAMVSTRDGIVEVVQERGAQAQILWITGDVAEEFVLASAEVGIEVRAELQRESAFRPSETP